MSTTDPRLRPTVTQYGGDHPSAGDDYNASIAWVGFAVTLLGLAGVLNLIDGIAAVSNSKFFVADAQYVVSSLNTLGWVLIVLGGAQCLTAIGVFARVRGARWVGVTVAALNAIAQMLVISAYPWWALTLFVLDVLVIYGLIAHGARAHAD